MSQEQGPLVTLPCHCPDPQKHCYKTHPLLIHSVHPCPKTPESSSSTLRPVRMAGTPAHCSASPTLETTTNARTMGPEHGRWTSTSSTIHRPRAPRCSPFLQVPGVPGLSSRAPLTPGLPREAWSLYLRRAEDERLSGSVDQETEGGDGRGSLGLGCRPARLPILVCKAEADRVPLWPLQGPGLSKRSDLREHLTSP